MDRAQLGIKDNIEYFNFIFVCNLGVIYLYTSIHDS